MTDFLKDGNSRLSNNDHSLKVKYLMTGAILANLIPGCTILFPEVAFVAGIYSLPLFAIEKVWHLNNYLVVDNGFAPVPQKYGILIAILFWSLIGACIGKLSFHIQSKRGEIRGSTFWMINKIGGLYLSLCIIGYAVFAIIIMFVYR